MVKVESKVQKVEPKVKSAKPKMEKTEPEKEETKHEVKKAKPEVKEETKTFKEETKQELETEPMTEEKRYDFFHDKRREHCKDSQTYGKGSWLDLSYDKGECVLALLRQTALVGVVTGLPRAFHLLGLASACSDLLCRDLWFASCV